MACTPACPTNAISGERKQVHTIDQKLCIKCDTCRQVCKFDAIPVVDAQPALVEGRQQ
jgi:Fe-S-cluster-containing hydrogenase component 2